MKKKAFILIIIAGIIWGTTGIFVKFLSRYGFSSLQMTAVRGLISFLAMTVYVLCTARKLFKIRLSDSFFFIPIGTLLFSTAFLYYTAMTMSSVSTAVVLMYMAPVYVMAFSIFFLSEKFSTL